MLQEQQPTPAAPPAKGPAVLLVDTLVHSPPRKEQQPPAPSPPQQEPQTVQPLPQQQQQQQHPDGQASSTRQCCSASSQETQPRYSQLQAPLESPPARRSSKASPVRMRSPPPSSRGNFRRSRSRSRSRGRSRHGSGSARDPAGAAGYDRRADLSKRASVGMCSVCSPVNSIICPLAWSPAQTLLRACYLPTGHSNAGTAEWLLNTNPYAAWTPPWTDTPVQCRS